MSTGGADNGGRGDAQLEELSALARAAEPSTSRGAHLTDETLRALRAGGEDDEAFRHLASCPSCRARMTVPVEEARGAIRRAEKASGGDPAEAASRPKRAASRRWVVWAAAAALLGAFALLALRRPHEEAPLVVAQRAYVGTMGTADVGGADVARGDLDIDLSFPAEGAEAAVLLVYDEAGRGLAPPRPFVLGPDGTMKAVVAPRTFPPHAGSPRGLVIAGTHDAVADSVNAARAADPREGLSALTARVRTSAASHGARVALVTFSE